MIPASLVLGYLKKKGYNFFTGVPCSMLKGLLEEISNDPEVKYINAVRENSALGVASGAYLAGKPSCVLMQNSGLGNIVNTLTSFNLIYKIPVILFITWRGFEGKDAPEHRIMGRKTIPLLKELGIPFVTLTESFESDIDWAIERMHKSRIPVALILKPGILE